MIFYDSDDSATESLISFRTLAVRQICLHDASTMIKSAAIQVSHIHTIHMHI